MLRAKPWAWLARAVVLRTLVKLQLHLSSTPSYRTGSCPTTSPALVLWYVVCVPCCLWPLPSVLPSYPKIPCIRLVSLGLKLACLLQKIINNLRATIMPLSFLPLFPGPFAVPGVLQVVKKYFFNEWMHLKKDINILNSSMQIITKYLINTILLLGK